jgi:hypothetical protein
LTQAIRKEIQAVELAYRLTPKAAREWLPLNTEEREPYIVERATPEEIAFLGELGEIPVEEANRPDLLQHYLASLIRIGIVTANLDAGGTSN